MTAQKVKTFSPVSSARVAVCMPVYGWVPAEAAASVAAMLLNDRSLLTAYKMVAGTYVSTARNQLIEQAMAHNPTHLLFLDSDMIVPPDACRRLLSHNKNIVSGLYFTRSEPYRPVCRQRKEWDGGKSDKSGEHFLDDRPPAGFSEVSFIGFGCVLVAASVIRKAVEEAKGPVRFFSFSNDDEGEDVYFCRLMHRLGEKIYLDPECECGHVGTTVVTRKTYEFGNGHGQTAG